MPNETEAFKQFILRIADAIRAGNSIDYGFVSQAELNRQLIQIDHALTRCLQVLISLDLAHRDGQDLETEPFNFPLVSELAGARTSAEIFRRHGPPDKDFERSCYPTVLLREMVELRDAARAAAIGTKPQRGNATKRTQISAITQEVGMNFVFQFRSRFGHMPPISKTGWIVDLLAEALRISGAPGIDAADVLRRSIERDSMREMLPAANNLRATKRRPK
jgi:hypothetical protein